MRLNISPAYRTIAFLLLVKASFQQSTYTTPCRRWLHQTCIVNNRLYTDGGLIYQGSSFANQTAQKNNYLLWEDLSTEPPLSAANGGFPVQNAIAKNTSVPIVTGGALWADDVNKLFYLYGGSHYDSSPTSFQLWLYDVIYQTWNTTQTGQNQNTIVPTTNGASAVDGSGRGYYYGGYANNLTSPGWHGSEQMQSDLVVYDFADNSWSSLTPTTGNVPRAEGVLLYLPASDQGMLVYFGGLEDPSNNGTRSFANMTQIHLFDVKSQLWYTQTATGTIPLNRRGFSAGATWADDFSSYNIYLYGGFSETGQALGDGFILSLPSFEWIQYYSGATPTDGGKGWTTSNVYSRSQMIVMGGYYTNLTLPDCDQPLLGNQHGLSLGKQNPSAAWWFTFQPNVTTYDVPSNITAVIGGGASGSATVRTPSGGFANGNQDLAVYFTRSYTATPSPTRAVTTASAAPTSSSSGSGTNVGAIAGGVVGGVIGLVAILALAIFCLRRRKKSRSQRVASGHQQYPHHDKNSSYVSEVQPHSPSTQHHSPAQQYYTPQDSPQVPQGSPPTHHQEFSAQSHHQRDFSNQVQYQDINQQAGRTWYQDSPSGTNWNPVPVFQAGPTQPAGPAPMHSPRQTYYPPPPRPQHSSHGEERAELPTMRTPVPLDGMMLQQSDQRDWGR